MRWPALALAALSGALLIACGSDGERCGDPATASSPKVACAAGLDDFFRDQAAVFSWEVYCPSFLPAGATVDRSRTTFANEPPGRGLSTAVVTTAEGDVIEIFQGYILIVPRNEEGLPGATPEREVLFGDVPATLFDSPMPMIRADVFTGGEITRAIRGSEGMDPEVLARVAEGMRRVELEP